MNYRLWRREKTPVAAFYPDRLRIAYAGAKLVCPVLVQPVGADIEQQIERGMQALVRHPGIFAGHFHVQAFHGVALLLVCPFNGFRHAPVANRQHEGQNGHVLQGHKVQAQNKLLPVVALVKAREKAVIMPAFHLQIARFKI